MTLKYLNRKIRVLRLLAVVQAYHHYTMMQLNSKLLQCDVSWQDAEHLSSWFGTFISHREYSPTDFLHDKNEVCDTALDNYNGFKKWVEIAASVGVTEKTLTAFCKNVDNLQSVFLLKAFGHVLYPDWLMALFLYLDKAISKAKLQAAFVEYSLFSGKAKPANIAEFRKTVLDIEKTVWKIMNKQLCREVRKIRNE
jgi:hypothetical protein